MSSKPKKPKLISLFFSLSFLVFSAIAFPLTSGTDLPVQTTSPSTLPRELSQDTKDTTPSKRSAQHDFQPKNNNLNMMVPTAIIKHTSLVSEHISTHGSNLDTIIAIVLPTELPLIPTAVTNLEKREPRSQVTEGSIYPTGAAEMIQAQTPNSGIFTALSNSKPSAVNPTPSHIKTESLSHQRHRKESIWSAVIFITPGERTPSTNLNDVDVADAEPTLTEMGVRQMKMLGKMFRRRYLPGVRMHPAHHYVHTPIPFGGEHHDLSHGDHYYHGDDHNANHDTNHSETQKRDVYDLFNPHHNNRNHTRLINLPSQPNFTLATLSTLETDAVPESGILFWTSLFHHYPSIHTISSYDPTSISLDGTTNCVAHSHLRNDWANSSIASKMEVLVKGMGEVGVDEFLHSVSRNFQNVDDGFGREFWSLRNVLRILDSVRAYTAGAEDGPHFTLNGTEIPRTELLQILAGMNTLVQTSLYGNLTAENGVGQGISNAEAGNVTRGSVATIGGAALAKRVRDTILASVEDEGATAKLDVLVGEAQQLFSLLVLTNAITLGVMDTVPPAGSVIAFEIFSLTDTEVEGQVMPGTEALKVRLSGNLDMKFKYSSMETLGMFGDEGSMDGMPYETFLRKMEEVALGGTGDWCLQCGNQMDFCATYGIGNKTTERVEVVEVERKEKAGRRQMRPAVAGVVGAVILLSVFTGVAGCLMGCFGMRCYRDRNKAVEGFNGNKKAGSGDGNGHPRDAVSRDANGGESWELTSTPKAFSKSRNSFDSGVKATTVAERV